VTHDSNIFSSKTPYIGFEVVQLGNGIGKNIRHISSAKFTNPNTMTTLHLHNLLHVPFINKNLMSVSQFAKDNIVYFEFFS